MLYKKCLDYNSNVWNDSSPRLWLPRMDITDSLRENVMDLLMQGYQIKIAGNVINRNPYVCPFVARGATVIRWDGEMSPCLPLLYEHSVVYDGWERHSHPYFVGNIFSQSLMDLWQDLRYRDLRENLIDMKFSPCVVCRSCQMSEDNLLDCAGFEHPNCGGCLWPHGVVQCP